jgi:hypothetical protein
LYESPFDGTFCASDIGCSPDFRGCGIAER